MILSLIAAMAENRVIGRDGRMPWHLPKDLARFRRITLGHTVIMGRKTYEGLGRPFPGRRNIIITRQEGFRAEGCTIVHDLAEALVQSRSEDEVFVVGGEELFREAMDRADRIYLTLVHTIVEGDAYFPAMPREFSLISREPAVDTVPIEFQVYERVRKNC